MDWTLAYFATQRACQRKGQAKTPLIIFWSIFEPKGAGMAGVHRLSRDWERNPPFVPPHRPSHLGLGFVALATLLAIVLAVLFPNPEWAPMVY